MAITKKFYVELDLKQATGNRDFTLVEGDTGNIIHVTLTDDGTPVDLSDCRVLAVFTKPTGSSMQDSEISDGGVTIGGENGNEVTIDLFAGSFGTGTNACELQIYSGTERDVLVTSAAFNFYCRNGIIDDDTIRSTDEYPLLTSLIRQVQAIEDGVLTPADVDAALSATSENPVQNKAVKTALAGKAASVHMHEKADVTDFPATMPPSAHTHGKADITDFPTDMPPSAHTHGSITSDGKIGSAANLPVFTGTGGALGTKAAADARTALGLGKQLWSGSWSSDSITVPDVSKYTVLAATFSSGTQAIGFVQSNGWCKMLGGTKDGERHYTYTLLFTRSGNVLTMTSGTYLRHDFGGDHGSNGTLTVAQIYGIV